MSCCHSPTRRSAPSASPPRAAREAPKPPEVGSAGNQWGTSPGWQVPVDSRSLPSRCGRRIMHRYSRPSLPSRHSPIRASGDVNQSVFLAAVPEPMVARLTKLFAGQVAHLVESITRTTGGSLVDDAAEELILQRTDIGPALKKTLLNARRGSRGIPGKCGADRA